MKERWEIILSGVGGQGLIVSGSILGEAATIYENKNATLTSSYGTETRGTFTKSDIIISDGDIYYPEVMKEDAVLALAQVAYNRYVGSLDEEAVLIYDSGLVEDVKASRAKQLGFPITDIARELGNPAVANIVALGIIVKLTGVVSPEAVVKAIEGRFIKKPRVVELNTKAFNRGMELVKD
ncbi:MAG: 2-oxoglutarate/2-oxoacid ferredoxin oxidoreductase, gamma subunit [Firmicutes bacterium]|nr:2-oxoglutarate/2-oxoacid ferredoxin oxidoreductase, gamma subunit [Bacillota bacterium]MDI6705956.1 2-oxoacid:acceptor oxidoreductase family protein [Bacillota bacterium]